MGTREVLREVLGDLFGLLVFTIIKFTLSISRNMDHQGKRTISLWIRGMRCCYKEQTTGRLDNQQMLIISKLYIKNRETVICVKLQDLRLPTVILH